MESYNDKTVLKFIIHFKDLKEIIPDSIAKSSLKFKITILNCYHIKLKIKDCDLQSFIYNI